MAPTNENILPRTPDNPELQMIRGLEGTGSVKVPAGYEAQQRLFARGSIIDGIKVAERMREKLREDDLPYDAEAVAGLSKENFRLYQEEKKTARIERQKISDQITEQIDYANARLADMDRTGPIGKMQAWLWAAGNNALMMGELGNIAIRGEKETAAIRYAAQLASYHEPDGMFDKYMTMAAGNIFSTSIPLLAGLVPGGAGLTGVTASRLGTALAASAMAIPTTTESYLDLKQRGLPTNEAMLTAGIHGIVETGIEFTLGNFLIGGANKALRTVGLKGFGATPGKVARSQQIFGILAKDDTDDAIGALVRGVDSGKLDTAAAKIALKEFFGDGSRAKVLAKLFREGPMDAFTGGAEEWLQQGAELYIKELALTNAGLDGVIPKREDGSYDIDAVLSQMNDAFVAGAVLEGMMGGLGGLAGAKSGWNTAKTMENMAHYLRGRTVMEVTPKGKVVGPAGQGAGEGNITIDLSVMGPEAMDYITRHTLARRITEERKAKEKYKDGVIPDEERNSIASKALTEATQHLLDNQQQAAMLQFADAKFEMKGDNVMTLKVGNQTVTILNSSGIPGTETVTAKYLHKEGDASTIGVSQELWDKLVKDKLTDDVIGVHLYQGTTLPHEILHEVITNMDEGPRQIFLDTIKVGENVTPAQTYKEQQEGLARGSGTPGQLGGIEAYTQGRYYAPVQTTLFDMWAGVDVAFNGRHASDTSKQRVLYRKTFGVLTGKKDLDFSKIAGEGFLRTSAIPMGKTIGSAVSKVASKVGQTGKIAYYKTVIAIDDKFNPKQTSQAGIPMKPVSGDETPPSETGLNQTIMSHVLPEHKMLNSDIVIVESSIGDIYIPEIRLTGEYGSDLDAIWGYGNFATDTPQPKLKRSLSVGDTIKYRNHTIMVMPGKAVFGDGVKVGGNVFGGAPWRDVTGLSPESIKIIQTSKNAIGIDASWREAERRRLQSDTGLDQTATTTPYTLRRRELRNKEIIEINVLKTQYQTQRQSIMSEIDKLVKSVPVAEQAQYRQELIKRVRDRLTRRVKLEPKPTEKGLFNAVNALLKTAGQIAKHKSSQQLMQQDAALEKLDNAIVLGNSLEGLWTPEKSAALEATFFDNADIVTLVNLPELRGVFSALSNILNSAEYDAMYDIVHDMARKQQTDNIVELNRARGVTKRNLAAKEVRTYTPDIDRYVKNTRTGKMVRNFRTPTWTTHVGNITDAQYYQQVQEGDSLTENLASTYLTRKQLNSKGLNVLSTQHLLGQKQLNYVNVWFPFNRDLLIDMFTKLGVTVDEKFLSSFTFDAEGTLTNIREFALTAYGKQNISAITKLTNPLWMVAYYANTDPQVRALINGVFNVLQSTETNNPHSGRKFAIASLYAIGNYNLRPVPQTIPNTGVRTTGPLFITPQHIVEWFKRRFNLHSDGSYVGYENLGDSDIRPQTQLTEIERSRQITNRTSDEFDAESIIEEQTAEETDALVDQLDEQDIPVELDQSEVMELGRASDFAYDDWNTEQSLSLTAEQATRDFLKLLSEVMSINGMTNELFDSIFGKSPSEKVDYKSAMSPMQNAKRVLNFNKPPATSETVPASELSLSTFKFYDAMRTVGEMLETIGRRYEGNNPYPSAVSETTDTLAAMTDTTPTKESTANKVLDELVNQFYPKGGKPATYSTEREIGRLLTAFKTFREALSETQDDKYRPSVAAQKAIDEYLKLDPTGKTLNDLLDSTTRKFFGGIGLDQTASPLIDLPRGERLTTIKDLLNGIRDVRIFKLQLDTLNMSTAWLKIFGITPVGRMRDLLKGFFNSLMGKNLEGTNTTGFEAGELARKYSLAAMFWVDIKNTMAMADAGTVTPEAIVAGYRKAIDGVITKLTGDGTTRLKADESLQLSEYVKYKEAVEVVDGLVAGTDTYTAAVNDFIENTYKPMADKAWDVYRADTIKTHDAKRVPYYSPWLFLNDKEQYDPEDMDMNSYSQLTGRTLARSNYNLNNHLENGRVFRHPDIISSWESAISQLIHAVSNKEFIEKSLDAGYFSLEPMAGYKALKAKGAAAMRFILDGVVYKSFDEAFKDLKGKKDKDIVVKPYTVYAPAVEADYFNHITKTSGIRSSNIGRALMATNAKLKLVRVAWSMFHRRSLLWGAVLAGPIDPGMEFTKGDLKDWTSLWTKIKSRYDYTKLRDLGNQLMEERNPWVFAMTYHGMTNFRTQDFGDVNLEYLTKLDKALIGTPVNTPHAMLKSTVVGISRMTRAFQNELFGKFGASLKAAYGFRELQIAIKKNMAKIIEEKTENAKTGSLSTHYQAFVEANGADHAGTKQMEDNYDGVGKYASKTEDNILRSVAGIANANFGGIHLKRLGVSPGQFDLLRLLFLGPDWTASNFLTVVKMISNKKAGGAGANSIVSESTLERQIYNAYWMRALGRSAAIIFVINLLMSAIDDETAIERLTKAYKKGGLKATMIDISPVIHMLGGNKEVDHYLNFAGIFTEPLRWAKEPVKSVYYKSSTVLKPVMEAFMGTDYKGQRPTPIQDIPSKGLYSWENKNFGPISASESPAFLFRQMTSVLPIGASQIFDLFTGEENVITTAIEQGTGIDIKRTYPAVRKSTSVGIPYQPSYQAK